MKVYVLSDRTNSIGIIYLLNYNTISPEVGLKTLNNDGEKSIKLKTTYQTKQTLCQPLT